MAIRTLYPCYFDVSLTRKEGRRVAKPLAVAQPNITQISRAAKAAGLVVAEEDLTAKHPAHWFAAGGRIRVEYPRSKEELMKTIAAHLGKK